MKIKTSISISDRVLHLVKRIAKRDDRSVSYVLERFIEDRVREDAPEESRVVKLPSVRRKVIYPKPRQSK